MDSNLSAADIMALTSKDKDCGIGGAWNNPFIYLVWLALLGNGGLFGGNKNGELAAADQGALTRNAIYEANGNQDLQRSIGNLGADIGSFERDAAGAWSNIRYDLSNGFTGIGSTLCNNRYDMMQGFGTVNQNIADSRFAAQDCCCTTNRNIDSVKAENYKNTCDITTAIHNEAEATRALINANTMQDLRDKLADRDRELLMSNFSLSQQIQNQSIIGALKPCPIPAYTVSSPYASVNNTCGCGLGI